MTSRILISVFTFLALLTAASPALGQHTSAAPILSSYFDMMVSGNFESASFFWNRAAQDRSAKFGIQYQNIPLKIDCNSPIVQNLKVMKDYLQPPVKRYEDLFEGKYQKLYYSAIVQGQNIEHTYYAEFDGRYYWLAYPQDIYARDWPIKETEYFRIHINPDLVKYCTSAMFDEADKFVARMGDSLGLSTFDMRHLQSNKIEFFYCISDGQVEEITGQKTRGVYDKPSSDIISSFFPHNHEVAHLLIDYRLRQLPLFVHPLFEEGLAVNYGGRWGKTPESLMPLGIFLYNEGIVSLDSILSFKGFRNNAESDLAYPLAGLFTKFLLERIGRDRYLTLYREMAGTSKQMSEMPVDTVKAHILRAATIGSWDKLLTAFQKYLTTFKTERYVALPGNSGKGAKVISNKEVVVSDNGEWLEFQFNSPDTSAPRGNLLFGKSAQKEDSVSAMFKEHYENEIPYEGYRYGVRYDVNEAGLYDYAANMLLAKYIAAVDPSKDYYNAQNHKITVRIRKNLTNGVLPSETDYKLLNH